MLINKSGYNLVKILEKLTKECKLQINNPSCLVVRDPKTEQFFMQWLDRQNQYKYAHIQVDTKGGGFLRPKLYSVQINL